MNNKILARIAAAAMSVAMVGTACFATAPSVTVDGQSATLSFVSEGTNLITANATEGAEYVTMMAYLVGADATIANCDYVNEATTPMIALEQVKYAEIMNSVPVLASKLTENYTQAVVKTGDSLSGGSKWLFALETTAGGDQIITLVDGTTVTNLEVDAEGYVTLPTTATWSGATHSTFTFSLYSWVAVDATTGAQAAEYVVGTTTKVLASDIAGKKLYAKFKSDYQRGDVDGDGEVGYFDSDELYNYALSVALDAPDDYLGLTESIYLNGPILGDVDEDAEAGYFDSDELYNYALSFALDAPDDYLGLTEYVYQTADDLYIAEKE